MDIKNNLQTLWNYTEANLWVDPEQNISVISKWNLLYRVIKVILDFNGGITKKINEAVKETFNEFCAAVENNQNDLYYVYDASDIKGTSLYPAFLVAQRVQSSNQFKMNIQICDVAGKTIETTTNLFPNSKEPLYRYVSRKILSGLERKQSHPAYV